MKKTYSKPEILFEDFSLSTSIAAGCEYTNGLHAQGDCGYETRDGIVFVIGVSGCKYTQPDTNDSLCYHVPNEYNNIFSS